MLGIMLWNGVMLCYAVVKNPFFVMFAAGVVIMSGDSIYDVSVTMQKTSRCDMSGFYNCSCFLALLKLLAFSPGIMLAFWCLSYLNNRNCCAV